MKILLVHSGSLSRLPSGEQLVAELEQKWFEENNHEVRLIVFGSNDARDISFFERLTALFKNIWSVSAANEIKSVIVEYQPDIVHFHGLMPFLSPSVLKSAHENGVGVVQTLHNARWICLEGAFFRNGVYCDECGGSSHWYGVFYGCNRGLVPSFFFNLANITGRYRNNIFNWVDKFIAVSGFIRNQHVADGFPVDKIVVKNNGIDLSRFDLKSINLKDRSGIAYVSRISQAKGSGVIKHIIQNISCQVHVVGDGPDLLELKHLCLNNNYSHVKFWGKLPQEQCFSIMSSVVCTVIASQCGEAFPLVACESMTLSTPVIAADIGGLGSLAKQSGGGVAVKYDDHSAYIDAIEQLLENLEMASIMGARGRRYVEENLNIDDNIQELIGIYEDVLKEKNQHASDL